MPGGYANVLLALGEAGEAVLVPGVAVMPGRESAVFVLDGEDTARRRPVQLGRRERESIQILDGLEAGERLVVAGVQNIRDGQKVRVLNGEDSAAQ